MRNVLKMKLRNKRGQAAIETALALPFVIALIYYTLNAYHSISTAQTGQKFAAMNLYQRLQNRAKFVVDAKANDLHGREYMAVQYTDSNGALPRRRILLEGSAGSEINVSIGVCKEPAGKCTPE